MRFPCQNRSSLNIGRVRVSLTWRDFRSVHGLLWGQGIPCGLWRTGALQSSSRSVFAGLAAVGVYGVLAYTVEQSKQEIGDRLAHGTGRAPRAQILRLFLGQGVKWAILVGVAGLLAACILVRFMRSMLLEVGPYDPRTFWQPGRQCSQSLC
jgi:hypothetical protein